MEVQQGSHLSFPNHMPNSFIPATLKVEEKLEAFGKPSWRQGKQAHAVMIPEDAQLLQALQLLLIEVALRRPSCIPTCLQAYCHQNKPTMVAS